MLKINVRKFCIREMSELEVLQKVSPYNEILSFLGRRERAGKLSYHAP